MSRTTQDPVHDCSPCAYGTLTPCGGPSQTLRLQLTTLLTVLQPRCCLQLRFGLLRFRSPLLAESSLFLGLLRCFTSPGSPCSFRCSDTPLRVPGFPIRIPPGSYGCTRLAGAFRSVPRPSSALDAKASTECPYFACSCDTEKLMLSRYFAMHLSSCAPANSAGPTRLYSRAARYPATPPPLLSSPRLHPRP